MISRMFCILICLIIVLENVLRMYKQFLFFLNYLVKNTSLQHVLVFFFLIFLKISFMAFFLFNFLMHFIELV